MSKKLKINYYLRNLVLALALVLASACASTPKKVPAPAPKTQTPASSQQSGAVNVDIDGLKRSLGLDRSKMDLGYKETRFDTCNAGFGYPRDNCKEQVFASINFRLLCRDSVGTTSEIVTSAQMAPIANKKVRWQLVNVQSVISTDEEGYGQVNGVFSPASSPKVQRLKLTVGTQSVYIRAGQLTRVVTPADFCSQN